MLTNYPTLTDKQYEVTLPTELASYFINGDASVLDAIGDDYYKESVDAFMYELELDGYSFVDIVDDNQFTDYHDLTEFGILATNCSTYIVTK